MKLKFKHQKFQADAAKAVCDVYSGQPFLIPTYMMDKGNLGDISIFDEQDFTGWNNHRIVPELNDNVILENLNKVQRTYQIEPSKKLEGRYNLTVEMETGERVIIVTGCINALRSRVSGTLVNMIHALLRVIKYNYCKQCMRSKDVLALQY